MLLVQIRYRREEAAGCSQTQQCKALQLHKRLHIDKQTGKLEPLQQMLPTHNAKSSNELISIDFITDLPNK